MNKGVLKSLLVTTLVLYFIPDKLVTEYYQPFYEKALRGQLASVILALSAFLFAVKTFVIINMYEKVYSNDSYRKDYVKKNMNSEESVYKRLYNLNDLLLFAIYFSVGTSLYHLILGFFSNVVMLKLGIVFVLETVIIFIMCILFYQKNMKAWVKILDKKWKVEKKSIRDEIQKENNKRAKEDAEALDNLD